MTKKQVIAVIRPAKNNKTAKKLLAEIQKSDRDNWSDEEVMDLQIQAFNLRGSWNVRNDDEYDYYNGCYPSIWD